MALSVRSSRILVRRARANGWSTTVSCTRDTVAAGSPAGPPSTPDADPGRRSTTGAAPIRRQWWPIQDLGAVGARRCAIGRPGRSSTRNPWWTLRVVRVRSSSARVRPGWSGHSCSTHSMDMVDVAPARSARRSRSNTQCRSRTSTARRSAGRDDRACCGRGRATRDRRVRSRSRLMLPSQASQRARAAEIRAPNPRPAGAGRRWPGRPGRRARISADDVRLHGAQDRRRAGGEGDVGPLHQARRRAAGRGCAIPGGPRRACERWTRAWSCTSPRRRRRARSGR